VTSSSGATRLVDLLPWTIGSSSGPAKNTSV
jgi:hypothetical protein